VLLLLQVLLRARLRCGDYIAVSGLLRFFLRDRQILRLLVAE